MVLFFRWAAWTGDPDYKVQVRFRFFFLNAVLTQVMPLLFLDTKRTRRDMSRITLASPKTRSRRVLALQHHSFFELGS